MIFYSQRDQSISAKYQFDRHEFCTSHATINNRHVPSLRPFSGVGKDLSTMPPVWAGTSIYPYMVYAAGNSLS